jgi:phosphoenolpyruvate carboxylase
MVRLVQRLIVKKMRVYQEEFSIPKMDVQLVPLVEDVERFLEIHRFITILYNAVKDYGIEMHNLRVFIGKSDAAVKAGHIASSIGVVLALYKTLIVDKELDLDIKPIIGMGMPTFRGGINNPTLVEHEVRCYQGFRTVTIQSAIRYDNPFEKYRKVYTVLSEWIDKPARAIDEGIATRIIENAMSSYRKLVSRYLEVVNRFSERIPSTRERVSWREYGRRIELGDKLLNVPRAIVFTATWYTLGVPPTYLDAEYIINAYRSGEIDEVLKLMPQLLNEWRYELQFYVPSIASKRLDEHIVKVINEALDYMGLKPEPNELYKSIAELEPMEYYILALASIRGFLG